MHPRAQQAGQRFILPGQWEGLPRGDNRPRREAVAVAVAVQQTPVGEVAVAVAVQQTPVGEVERRSLEVYELAVGGAR